MTLSVTIYFPAHCGHTGSPDWGDVPQGRLWVESRPRQLRPCAVLWPCTFCSDRSRPFLPGPFLPGTFLPRLTEADKVETYDQHKRHPQVYITSSHHMEKTEAGLKGLCIREIMTEYTLYYTKYYTIILRFPMAWRSAL